MTRPVVSIIIPCYKQAHLLHYAIESALRQSYRDVQVVVVNDGSPDDTAAVAAGFSSKVDYVEQGNGGLAAARNAGIRHAAGKYLLFLDADDLLHSEAVEWLVQAAPAQENVIVRMGYRDFVHDPDENGSDHLPPDHDTLLPWLFRGAMAPCHTQLCSREWVMSVGMFRNGPRIIEDWDLWLRLALAGAQLVSVPRIGAFYRRYLGSMSSDRAQMVTSRIDLLLHAYTIISKNPKLLASWGQDIVNELHSVRREVLICRTNERLVPHLTQACSTLRRCGIMPSSRPIKRMLDKMIGPVAEDVAVWYLRTFRRQDWSH